jgi:hypothetical protein
MNAYDNLYLAYNINDKELFLVLPPNNINNFTINYIDIYDSIDNNHIIDDNIIENHNIQTRYRTKINMLCLLIIIIIAVTITKLVS